MNVYSQATATLVTELATGLAAASYAPLSVIRVGQFRPRNLPAFDRYMVVVAAPTESPWKEERLQSSRLVNYVLRVEIYLLVKNYDEDLAVYGETAPNLGVFQMIEDTKTILRTTDLGGRVERTYRETEGGSSFETGATGGMDTGGYSWVHRARLVYTPMMRGFCNPA